MKYDATIIHVNLTHQMVIVTYNGIARLYRPQRVNLIDLIGIYKRRGFKYVWLNKETVLLTKKTARTEAKAA